MKNTFKVGELVLYRNGDTYQIGKIKSLLGDSAFVYYTSGDTASKTTLNNLIKLENNYVITQTNLGGKF